jgi:hypothetical protein
VLIDNSYPNTIAQLIHFNLIEEVHLFFYTDATEVKSLDALANWPNFKKLVISNFSPHIEVLDISSVSHKLTRMDITSVTTLYETNEHFKNVNYLSICQPRFVVTEPIRTLMIEFDSIPDIVVDIFADIADLYCYCHKFLTSPECLLNIDQKVMIESMHCFMDSYMKEFEDHVFTPMKEYADAHPETLTNNLFLAVIGANVDVDVRRKHVKLTNHVERGNRVSFDITQVELMQILHEKSSIEITSLHDLFPSNDAFPNIQNIVISQPTFSITQPVNSCKSSCNTLVVNQDVNHLELLNSPSTEEPKVTIADHVEIKTIKLNVDIQSYVNAVQQYLSTHPKTSCPDIFPKHAMFHAQTIDDFDLPFDIGSEIGSYLPNKGSNLPDVNWLRKNMVSSNSNKTLKMKREHRLRQDKDEVPKSKVPKYKDERQDERDVMYSRVSRYGGRRTKHHRKKSKQRKKTRHMKRR